MLIRGKNSCVVICVMLPTLSNAGYAYAFLPTLPLHTHVFAYSYSEPSVYVIL